MKSRPVLFALLLLIVCSLFAQSPSGFNYQAVVRNNAGELLSNQTIGIRMTLLQGSATGTVVYRETFSKTTDTYGLIDLVVGSGTVSAGSFSNIDWGAGPYFMETAIDQNGGSNYVALGTSQLMSVPFAMYAASAANDGQDGQDGADGKSAYQIWLDAGNTGTEDDFLASLVGEGSSPQDISLNGTDLSISEGSTIDLSVIDTDTKLTETEVDGFVSNNGYLTSETQDLSLAGTNLSITGGSSIDLSTLTNFTDTQLSEAEVDAFVANNGYLTSFTEVDGDVTNELQDISLAGTELTISDGSTVDLSTIDTDTQLSEVEVDAFVANNGYLTSFTEVDGDATNELQDISLIGTDLSISDGSTVDLSGIDTNTQLSEAEVDDFVANNGYLTSFTEVDGDATNELQDISLVGTDLSISDGSTLDLSGINTDTQLSEVEVDAFVANNGYLRSFTEVDGDVTNELQTLSVAENGELLTISGGNTVILSGLKEDITNELITNVALNGSDLEITDAGGTITTNLSALIPVEADPVFAASDVSDVTSAEIASWDEAAAWGNHADQNYLTNETQNLSDVLIVSNDAGGEPITNLKDPTDPQDAATKAYVDLLEATVTTLSDALDVITYRVDLLEGNYADLIAGGANGRDLLDDGVTVTDLINDGMTVQEMLDANITVKELLDAGKVAADFYGVTYQGGFIFYVDEADGSGMIAFQEDDISIRLWGDASGGVIGSTLPEIGTGAQNTIDIVSFNGSFNSGLYAAKICADLEANGFDDWFLPSLEELELLIQNLAIESPNHWSSTEADGSTAFKFSAAPTAITKNGSIKVRAARYFGGEVEQLIIAGETLQDLFDDGFTLGQLYAGGRTIDELESINPSPSIADLLNAEVSPVALYNNDNSVYSYSNQLASGVVSYGDLYIAGVSIDELEEAGADIDALLIAGVNPADLYANDNSVYSFQNLNNAGVSYAVLYNTIGATIDELELIGATVNDFVSFVSPLNDLYQNDPTGDYTLSSIFTALGADAFNDLEVMLNGNIPLVDLVDEIVANGLNTAVTLNFLYPYSSATIDDIYVALGGEPASDLQILLNQDVPLYILLDIGGIDLNSIRDNTTATASDFLLYSVIPAGDLLTLTNPFSVTEIYTALGGNPTTDFQHMLSQNVPLSAIFDAGFDKHLVYVNTNISIENIYDYYGGTPANLENLVTDGFNLLHFEYEGFYPNTISDLNTIRDNAPSATAYTFLMGSATGQNLLDLTSPYTVREIYVAEDNIDDDTNNNSVAITTLYGLIIPGEGTVFYTDDFFVTPYIVSDDLGTFTWGCSTNVDGTGELIGDGSDNTALILSDIGCANYPAAEACSANGTGWFLPSIQELVALYDSGISGLSDFHWSSSDGSSGDGRALSLNLTNGSQDPSSSGSTKSNSLSVRAVKVISE